MFEIGFTYRADCHDSIVANSDRIDFVEIIPDGLDLHDGSEETRRIRSLSKLLPFTAHGIDLSSAIAPGAFFYVVMPHGTEIAFHEIDGDSYALLKEIELLNEARDKDALAHLLEENRELLEVAASEGIVALCS